MENGTTLELMVVQKLLCSGKIDAQFICFFSKPLFCCDFLFSWGRFWYENCLVILLLNYIFVRLIFCSLHWSYQTILFLLHAGISIE